MIIDVFQDTVCPWCRIGKQHLYQALEAWHGEPVEIHWHAFLLDPTTPQEGRPFSDLIEKFGGEERAAQMHGRVCQVGEACGLNFSFEQIQRIPNTLQSHQLVKITPDGLQTQMVDAVMKAYFEDGLDIGHLDTLLDVAEKVGLNREETKARFLRGDGQQAVNDDLHFAREAGISGVPLFILNNKYALSGAQPVDVFLQAFEKVASEG